MNRWRQQLLYWLGPAVLVAVYGAWQLTNGHFEQFFQHQAWGSLLYANMWQHVLAGNVLVDPHYLGGEYFITETGQFVSYFGMMPVVIRALADIVLADIYAVNLTNLSMVLAALVVLGSVWYAVLRLARSFRQRLIGASIVLAVLFASPLSYLLAWGWTYHEVILWGVAWALLFVSMFSLWLFDRARFTRWHGALMGASVGLAVLSRPTIGLTLAIPYAYVCATSLLTRYKTHRRRDWRLLWPGLLVCAGLALVVMLINYGRWGNPLTFVKIDRNIQLVELFPERQAAIRAAGEFNVSRLPSSMHYYLVPSSGNTKAGFPFVTLDSELAAMNHGPHYDYVEGSRLPVLLSMPYLGLLAVLGALAWPRLRSAERRGSLWLLGGAALTLAALLTVYALALRYTAELVPPVVFLALVYVVALRRALTALPGWRLGTAMAIVGLASVYITTVTGLAYKAFIWDIPLAERTRLQQVIRFQPGERDTTHIINGERILLP